MIRAITTPRKSSDEAVRWLRDQPEMHRLVRDCYFDDPVLDACERFEASDEWRATRRLLGGFLPGRVLDLGAGRGIASFAFASSGNEVVAIEPDDSDIVGRGAIEQMINRSRRGIRVVDAVGESIPFPEAAFDVVYARAVLHHVRSLPILCAEVARVLRPGGVFLAVREHVISRREHLGRFLDSHPLHWMTGSEHAYMLSDYVAPMRKAGFASVRTLGPWESAINYAPATLDDLRGALINRCHPGAARTFMRCALGAPGMMPFVAKLISVISSAPGRHCTFLAIKGQ